MFPANCHSYLFLQFSSVLLSHSVVSDSLQPHARSTPGLLVHHQPPEFTQTHVHQVGDAIQPSHPLSSPSPLAFDLSQHQGLFKWVSSSHQVAKLLEFKLQHQSFQWIFRTDFQLFYRLLSCFSRVWLLQAHGLYVVCQSPLSMGFSRQEYWSGLPFTNDSF